MADLCDVTRCGRVCIVRVQSRMKATGMASHVPLRHMFEGKKLEM
jgi:hypothetical protein